MKIFKYKQNQVRVILIEDEPWFVASDVTDALQYSNSRKAILDHCKHPKLIKGNESLHLTSSPYGITIIPESDVYRLIMRSKMPEAGKFQDWVVEEVLPTIHRTGSYTPSLPNFEDPVAAARAWADAKEAELKALEEKKKVLEEKKKVERELDSLERSWAIHFEKGSTMLLKEFSKILGYKKVGPQQIYDILVERKILYRNTNKDVVPYQKYLNGHDYFRLTSADVEHNHVRGGSKVRVHTTTRITYRGAIWIRSLLDSWGYKPYKKKPPVQLRFEDLS